MSLANSLFVALTNINVPQDQAREVVEALEHKMNDSFATKSDIALIRGDIALAVSRIEKHEALTKAEFAAVRSETKAEFAAVRGEMKTEFAALRSETRAEFEAVRSETKAEFAAIRGETKAEFAAVRGESKMEFASLRADMKAIQTRLVIQLGTLIAVLLGVMPKLTAWLGW